MAVEDAKSIVERYTPKAYAIAFGLTGNRQDAWDLVQNAMIRVLRSYSTYDPAYTVDQWLYRIVRNLYVDRLRLEGRRKEQSLDQAPEEEGRPLSEAIEDPSPGPERLFARQEARARIQSALDELPIEHRMAVVLVDLEGYTYDEASRILEIPISTVGVHVFRGRKALRTRLAALAEEP